MSRSRSFVIGVARGVDDVARGLLEDAVHRREERVDGGRVAVDGDVLHVARDGVGQHLHDGLAQLAALDAVLEHLVGEAHLGLEQLGVELDVGEVGLHAIDGAERGALLARAQHARAELDLRDLLLRRGHRDDGRELQEDGLLDEQAHELLRLRGLEQTASRRQVGEREVGLLQDGTVAEVAHEGLLPAGFRGRGRRSPCRRSPGPWAC
jgi:hypothetical protein